MCDSLHRERPEQAHPPIESRLVVARLQDERLGSSTIHKGLNIKLKSYVPLGNLLILVKFNELHHQQKNPIVVSPAPPQSRQSDSP